MSRNAASRCDLNPGGKTPAADFKLWCGCAGKHIEGRWIIVTPCYGHAR